MYTIDEYSTAKAALSNRLRRSEEYSGNNPNKLRAELETASARLHAIETYLKGTGELERTPEEERDLRLDQAFPEAASREMVEWQGRRYMRRFTPVAKSLSGKTIKAWRKYWGPVRE